MNVLKNKIIFLGGNYLVRNPNELSKDSWGVLGFADANP